MVAVLKPPPQSRRGQLDFPPEVLKPPPQSARGQLGRTLFLWLDSEAIVPQQLSSSLVQRFLTTLGHEQNSAPVPLWRQRARLRLHLDQMHAQGLLALPPELLLPPVTRLPKLPPLGEQFLQTLIPTHKKGTCAGYRSCLIRFHRWLDTESLSMADLTRKDVQRWNRGLLDEGLHPATRNHLLIDLRAYLRWLHDYGQLAADPEDLIRRGEMPKLPIYLPRPLSPETDRELRQRLAASDQPGHQGLLLMRWTGIRVGELVSLHARCVHGDPGGYRALRVPLGKLDTERLVPIDDQTHQLIGRLLEHGACDNRRWLIETPDHEKWSTDLFRAALREASVGLDGGGAAITPHRLRHTYATTLLSGGMSLVGLMRLLGHRDYRMTLRYAAITQETVRIEYFAALTNVEARYARPPPAHDVASPLDPQKLAADLIRWLTTHAGAHPKAGALIKRLRLVQAGVARILAEPTLIRSREPKSRENWPEN